MKMENLTKEKETVLGFQQGLDIVYDTCTAKDYDKCLKEVCDVCMNTEVSCSSKASFYNKRRGKRPLSVAEELRLAKVFAKYGVTEWRGKGRGKGKKGRRKKRTE